MTTKNVKDDDTNESAETSDTTPKKFSPEELDDTVRDYLKEAKTRSYSAGVGEGKKRSMSELLAIAETLEIGTADILDMSDRDSAFTELSSRISSSIKAIRGKGEEDVKRTKEELKIRELEEANKSLTLKAKRIATNNTILQEVSKHDLHDPQLALTAFLAEHNVQQTDSGKIEIYTKSGEIMKSAGKNYEENLTLKEAFDDFLKTRTFLVKSPSQGRRNNVKEAVGDDLYSQFQNTKDPVEKARISLEMEKRRLQ